MPNPRPSAWALISVLVASLLLSPAAALTVSAAPSRELCQPEFKSYIWANDQKAPPFVFVLRTTGPEGIKGHVDKVPFWTYVGVVLKTEYSGSGLRGPTWQRMGALAIKQYAWYYINNWRGGKVAFTVTDPVTGQTTTTYECYHVKDSTADQLYKPIKWDSRLGPYESPEAWLPKNIPTPANLVGMRETWHMSLRKWKAKANKTAMFLTGYRSGKAVPCGTDSDKWKIYQASLRDCGEGAKNLTFEETIRKYLEPVYINNTRDHDILSDDGNSRGDLGVLVANGGGGTDARVYAGPASVTEKFGGVTTRSFPFSFSAITGQGTGNVHVPRFDENRVELNPQAMASDLFVLTGDKLWLARATGDGYADATSRDISATALLVDDFNGDMLADAGLVGPGGLRVLRSLGDGTFAADPAEWWSGDLTQATRTFIGAGDFNGDGKADMVVRNADGSYQTGLSRASCTYFGARGACPTGSIGAPGLRDLVPAQSQPWDVANVKHLVGDFDRDGRDDLMAVLRDGANIKVAVMRSLGDGTFGNPQVHGPFSVSFDNFTPLAMDINPDGMADIALVSATQVFWLRTIERTLTPASMTLVTPANTNGPGANFKLY